MLRLALVFPWLLAQAFCGDALDAKAAAAKAGETVVVEDTVKQVSVTGSGAERGTSMNWLAAGGSRWIRCVVIGHPALPARARGAIQSHNILMPLRKTRTIGPVGLELLTSPALRAYMNLVQIQKRGR